MKALTLEVQQCMQVTQNPSMDQITNLPNRLFVRSWMLYEGTTHSRDAEIDMGHFETARAILCGKRYVDNSVEFHGHLDGSKLDEKALLSWSEDVGASYTIRQQNT
jgi:hypothetical protein